MPATTKPNKTDKLISSTGKRLALPKYKITVICRAKNKDGTLTAAENVKASFKCPICNAALIYIAKERRLGGHGKSVDSKEHELRKVQELSE